MRIGHLFKNVINDKQKVRFMQLEISNNEKKFRLNKVRLAVNESFSTDYSF